MYGVECVGFLTLTFADHVTCAKEAGRRYNSLRTNVLAERYLETICVLERMKSGRIHFHLLVVMRADIRTGFSFEEASKGVYTSANESLRAEWAFWRRTAREYGFGRTELMPVKSNEEGLSKYVGKYIAKHVGAREERDKGVRLVRYSSGANVGSVHFMFASPRSRLWRNQVKKFAERQGCFDLAAVAEKLGKRWAYTHRAEIMEILPDDIVVGVIPATEDDPAECVTLRDVFDRDRQLRMIRIAEVTGEMQADVWMAMNPKEADAMRSLLTQNERALNRHRVVASYEESLARSNAAEAARDAVTDDDGERVDRVIVWNDGRVVRGVPALNL